MKRIIPVLIALMPGILLISSFTIKNELNESAPAQQVAGKWSVDKGHSNIKFTVTHMVVSDVEGSFKKFDGYLETPDDNFSNGKISFTIDVNSINTENKNRDKHLKSDDFFNAAKFPQMKFESTTFRLISGNKYELKGNLTIRDVTKPVTFDVQYGGITNAGKKTTARFNATSKINRFDYNLKWDKVTEAGSLVVGKVVTININVELNKIS